MSFASETRLKVVAVDDDQEILTAIEELLKNHPKLELVATGVNGRDALRLANRVRPDVILLDVRMPVLNGLEAAARIRACFPNITVVMLTSETEMDTVREALRAGAADYLSKFTDLPRLAGAVLDAHTKRVKAELTKEDAFFWGFYPTKGGSGCSTAAVNTALYLAMLEYKVLLIDLDTVNGDCGFLLNVVPRPLSRNLFYLLGELPEFESATVQKWVRRMPLNPGASSGPALDVLDSPGTFVPPGPHIEQNFETLLEFALKDYDYVVADFGPGRVNEWMTAAILDLSERLFVVTTRDMSSVKAMNRLTALMQESAFPVGKISVLLSPLLDQQDFDPAEHISPAKLHVRDVITMPLDRATASESIKKGVPPMMLSENAPMCRFAKNLVERALNLPPSHEKEVPSIWQRFRENFMKAFLGVEKENEA